MLALLFEVHIHPAVLILATPVLIAIGAFIGFKLTFAQARVHLKELAALQV